MLTLKETALTRQMPENYQLLCLPEKDLEQLHEVLLLFVRNYGRRMLDPK